MFTLHMFTVKMMENDGNLVCSQVAWLSSGLESLEMPFEILVFSRFIIFYEIIKMKAQ